MPALHVIRLLGPWTVRQAGATANFRVPGPPGIAGAATFVRRFQWVAKPATGQTLALLAPPLPTSARWALNGIPLGVSEADRPARFALPTPARRNELTVEVDDWPAAQSFPGAALAIDAGA